MVLHATLLGSSSHGQKLGKIFCKCDFISFYKCAPVQEVSYLVYSLEVTVCLYEVVGMNFHIDKYSSN